MNDDGALTDNVIVNNTLTIADTRSKAVKEADGLVLFETDARTIVRYRYQGDGIVDSTFTEDPSSTSSNDELETLQITDDGQILASYRGANLTGGLKMRLSCQAAAERRADGVVVAKPITHDQRRAITSTSSGRMTTTSISARSATTTSSWSCRTDRRNRRRSSPPNRRPTRRWSPALSLHVARWIYRRGRRAISGAHAPDVPLPTPLATTPPRGRSVDST